MKRRILCLCFATMLLFSLLSLSAQAVDVKTHTIIGRLDYDDGMTAQYKVSMPYFLGALELKLPLYDDEDGKMDYEECDVYVLCPPDGKDAGISVELTGPSYTVYTSAQIRAYLNYDGVKLSPLYDGDAGISTQDGGDLTFPSTGLYEGKIFFDYSVKPLDYVYSTDIPASLHATLSHFYIGCEYVLVLDEKSVSSFLENGTLADYSGIAFTGLRDLLNGKTPANCITDDDDFDDDIDRDEYHPASASMDNFKKTTAYTPGQFTDVSDQWFADAIAKVCELGLMKGNGDDMFRPAGEVTLAEAITIAVRLNSIYRGLGDSFPAGTPWYQPYVKYAVANDIIDYDDFQDYGVPATRAQMAYIFANALPDRELKQINKIASLPDVVDDDDRNPYGEEIFTLFRAGILTGSDSAGTFQPDLPITRAEAAAIIIRMALPKERVTVNF